MLSFLENFFEINFHFKVFIFFIKNSQNSNRYTLKQKNSSLKSLKSLMFFKNLLNQIKNRGIT